ncbi:unnamed protein product [Microthlaspi erraticum]|uniref:Uncharacterized protein n=1 Tax=Microthlaspi erraticum TaxID=1685480 RepID=A0A6D2JS92_9BRAS|nr:unnamed protein product [Microthlaspi erraticum]
MNVQGLSKTGTSFEQSITKRDDGLAVELTRFFKELDKFGVRLSSLAHFELHPHCSLFDSQRDSSSQMSHLAQIGLLAHNERQPTLQIVHKTLAREKSSLFQEVGYSKSGSNL